MVVNPKSLSYLSFLMHCYIVLSEPTKNALLNLTAELGAPDSDYTFRNIIQDSKDGKHFCWKWIMVFPMRYYRMGHKLSISTHSISLCNSQVVKKEHKIHTAEEWSGEGKQLFIIHIICGRRHQGLTVKNPNVNSTLRCSMQLPLYSAFQVKQQRPWMTEAY